MIRTQFWLLWGGLVLSYFVLDTVIWGDREPGKPIIGMARAESAWGALMDLARATNDQWLEINGAVDPVGDPVAATENSTSGLIELKRLEQKLRSSGLDCELHGTLQSWLHTRPGLQSKANAYLADLQGWLRLFLAGDVDVLRPERLRVVPITASDFPGLRFEISAKNPELLREWLLDEGTLFWDSWEIRELELVALGDATVWWLAGTWVYQPGRIL